MHYRELLKSRLREILPSRREEAALALLNLPLDSFAFILSFASKDQEISTRLLNEKLVKEKRLLLPKVENDELKIYQVYSLDELQIGSFGVLEPSTKHPFLQAPSIILVPGLGFDSHLHRIGYGKGFYDRLLAQYRSIPSWGIGFKEQWIESLPAQQHDEPLTRCIFV